VVFHAIASLAPNQPLQIDEHLNLLPLFGDC
jgi:hypothetical protein